MATGYGLDGPEIESRWGARFSVPVQTGPGAHPASCTMGTGFFPRVKSGRSVMLTPHTLLVPWSWKGRATPILPLWAVRPVQSLSACTRVHFTLPQCLYKGALYLFLPKKCWFFRTSSPAPGCGSYPASSWYRSSFLGLKRLVSEVHNWPPSSTGLRMGAVVPLPYLFYIPLFLGQRRFTLTFRHFSQQHKKGKGHPCTGTEALYRPYGP